VTSRGRFGPVPTWATWDDERLLELRLCDLKLTIDETLLRKRIERLYRELQARGLRFRPHVWLSSAWFSPDGVPGFAVPFYLAHPRLMRLEYTVMRSVEGGEEEEFMRLLRHETGHALTTAYRLHRRRGWRETFGKFSTPYRASYQPNPRSRDFVHHLDGWYAQSHPAEDFCETFAIWLRPRSNWRHRYADWGALKKLEYVHAEMGRIAKLSPPVRSRERTESLATLRIKLGEHYRRKAVRYAGDGDSLEDANLLALLPSKAAGNRLVGPFLRRERSELLKSVARLTQLDLYTIDQVRKRLAERAFALGARMPRKGGRRVVTALLTLETLKTVRGRRLEFTR